MRQIYFDNNATTPPSQRVIEKIPLWLEAWGNPSSIHWGGRAPKNILRESRRDLAKFLGVDPLEIVFTSGGSEANNLAIKGVFWGQKQAGKKHYLFSSVEHPSVRSAMSFLATQGAEVEVIPVKAGGEIDLVDLASRIRSDTALVSVMLANNETGAVFPVKEIAALAHSKGALVHSDCVQAVGKMEFSLRDLGVDLATFSGHKFYALKGAGLLYVKKGTTLESLIHGGGQERHRRAGTENLLAIASMAEMAKEDFSLKILETRRLRDAFEKLVKELLEGVSITSIELPRVSNTSSLVIDGVDGESLLMNLDLEGFAVSTGAACSSGSPEPSPTLIAMGLTRTEAQSSLRVSFGWQNTMSEVEEFVTKLILVVNRIRSFRALPNQGERHA